MDEPHRRGSALAFAQKIAGLLGPKNFLGAMAIGGRGRCQLQFAGAYAVLKSASGTGNVLLSGLGFMT